ncbi:MAG: CopD family protein [Janthinobacterium lividum]
MQDYVLWLKATHILAVIAWMVGMLYLPRLMVYHATVGPGTPQSETFKIMERRLLRGILTPALVAVWITGPWLAYEEGAFSEHWLHGKLLLVVLLSGVHGILAGNVRRFAGDANTKSPTYFRVVNEIPTVLLIGIVFLVVVKPF